MGIGGLTMNRLFMSKTLFGLLLSVLTVVSCSKSGGPSSDSVCFSVGLAGAGTRTAYSRDGVYQEGVLTRERIDWTDGDLVTVYSPEAMKTDWSHSADYRIVSHVTSADNLMSHAEVIATDADGKGLTWEAGTNHFYGMYPSVSMYRSTDEGYGWVGLDGTTLKGTIPSGQTLSWSGLTGTGNITGTPDMKYAFMFAKQTGRKGDSEVNLVFFPKFTAFEFTIGSGENPAVTLSSFKLETTESGAFLAGNFSMAGDTEAVTVESAGATRYVTVNFPAGTVVTPEKPLTFTVFALPKDLTKMQIWFTGTEIGDRKLVLNDGSGNPLSFSACKKYRLAGLSFPSILTAQGEGILWDLEAHGEGLEWY